MQLLIDIITYTAEKTEEMVQLGVDPIVSKCLIDWSCIKYLFEGEQYTIIELKYGNEVIESTTSIKEIQEQIKKQKCLININ